MQRKKGISKSKEKTPTVCKESRDRHGLTLTVVVVADDDVDNCCCRLWNLALVHHHTKKLAQAARAAGTIQQTENKCKKNKNKNKSLFRAVSAHVREVPGRGSQKPDTMEPFSRSNDKCYNSPLGSVHRKRKSAHTPGSPPSTESRARRDVKKKRFHDNRPPWPKGGVFRGQPARPGQRNRCRCLQKPRTPHTRAHLSAVALR